MSVTVYRPQVQVKLIKMVQRNGDGVAERYSGAHREFDLTPYLSENGGVKIVKDINEPAGAWNILLAEQPDRQTLDTLYARIEPMDMVEIRGSRTPHLYAGQPLPLISRGFVSRVGRPEAMGPDEPRRVVLISGQDSGKLWLIFRIFPEAIYTDPSVREYLDVFRLQAATGVEVAFQPVAETMRQLTTRVINRNVERMAAYSQQVVRPFKTDRITVGQGIVSPNMIAGFQGAYWELAQLIGDRPWNEFFIEEEEDAPTVVFRPVPYRDLAGNFIMPGAVDPGTIEVTDRDIISLESGRGDQRVANFFMTPPGASMLDASGFVTIAETASGTPFDREHGNNRPELYGLRKMVVASRLLPDQIGVLPSQAPQGERTEVSNHIVQWHIQRSLQLKAMNRDNSVLEEGSAHLKGSEALKPGRYLRVRRGSVVSEFYITRVAHDISPLEGWTSSLALERGNGFVERLKMPGSPFWAEGRRGAYSA